MKEEIEINMDPGFTNDQEQRNSIFDEEHLVKRVIK